MLKKNFSLQSRLTMLNTSLAGGVLLIFGITVYFFVTNLLMSQIDANLAQTVDEIIRNSSVGSVGELDVVTLPALELTAGVHIQYWDSQGALKVTSPGIQNLMLPLDPKGFNYNTTVLTNVEMGTTTLRVLTAPLFVADRRAGVIMAGTTLNLVNSVQQSLLLILILITFVSGLFIFVTSWFTIHRALQPLVLLTRASESITKAGDLSRRIPEDLSPADEVGSMIVTFNDTMARLESLFSSQQRFLADVSHELRTPLTVIKGNADLIQKFGPDEESIHTIKEEVDRLTRMVGDLLLLAKAESGRLDLSLGQVALDELLVECFQEMRVLAKEKAELTLVEIDQVAAKVDRDRIKQVIINLMANAINYTPQGGTVKLRLATKEDKAVISIEDNGPGIAEKDLENIFERFYRGEKARTRSKSGGYGLGLSIANQIVVAHGGRIEVVTQKDVGTTFNVHLPLTDK